MPGTLEAKVWLQDGFTQDLLGHNSETFKPQLPKQYKFPISEVLPSQEDINKLLVQRETEVIARPADREMAVAAARPDDRDDMRNNTVTAHQLYEKRAHYDPETSRQVRPQNQKLKKRRKPQQVVAEEDLEEEGQEENQKEEEGNDGVAFSGKLKPQDFVIVEEKKAVNEGEKGLLYLATVLEIKPLIMHLWVVNEKKKITPTYSKVGRKKGKSEWYRTNQETTMPPAGYTPWDIGTDKWRILASSPTFSAEMKTLLESSLGPFSFYKD